MNSKLRNAVLITGGGQRVGEYLVRALLQDTEFPVVFTYRTERPSVTALQELGAVAIQSDMTEDNALPNLVASITDTVSSLRAVIHNASVWVGDDKAGVGTGAYRSLFQLHVDAPIYLNNHLKPLLLKGQGLKDIISISDFRVSQTDPARMAYQASKAALQNISKNFAVSLAPDIKVNDIAPALIMFNDMDSEAYKQARLQEALLPIEPGADVVWQAVHYLMNSPYTTGSCLQLNGGRNLK